METRQDLETIDRTALDSLGGTNTWLDSLTMPFIKDAQSALTPAGFGDSLIGLHVPPGLLPRGGQPVTAIVGPAELLLGISIFLATSIGSWAVGKVCDEILDKKIGPSFRELKKRYVQTGPNPPPPIKFEFSVWYDVDEVYVRVIAELSAPRFRPCRAPARRGTHRRAGMDR